MKYIFLVLSALLLYSGLSATTYYFSSSYTGSTSNGQQSTPFKRMSTLDSLLKNLWPGVTVVAGDQFLLKRGDVFTITRPIAPSVNGTASAHIIISEYGSGDKPLISGWKEINDWTAVSGRTNVYTSTNTIKPNGWGHIPMLRVDGIVANVGRWPNADAANSGFKAWTSSGSNNFSDSKWSTYTDRPKNADGTFVTSFSTGEVATRTNHYRFDKNEITSTNHTVTTSFSYTAPANIGIRAGFGYFMQNHISLLDRHTEWCYNSSTDKVSIYLSSAPSNYLIEIPVVDKFIWLTGEDYFDIDNIDLTGCNRVAIMTESGSTHVRITNCRITNTGYAAWYGRSGSDIYINNNIIDSSQTFGLRFFTQNNTITNNVVRRTMKVGGMNYPSRASGDTFGVNCMGTAISMEAGDNTTIDTNRICQSGYSAILFNRGSHVRIRANFCDTSTMTTDDGGVLYTVNLVYENNNLDNRIENNILLHNNPTSTSQGGVLDGNGSLHIALYDDEWSNRKRWANNIIDGGQWGIYSNDPYLDTFSNNLIYNFSKAGMEIRNTHIEGISETTIQGTPITTPYIQNNYANGNVYLSLSAGTSPPPAELFTKKTTTSSVVYPTNYGTFTGQYFVYPLAQTNDNYWKTQCYNSTGYPSVTRSWSNWNSTFGYDGTKTIYRTPVFSGATSTTISKLVYNDTKQDKTIPLGGYAYTDVKTGTAYTNNTITLTPFTGKVLIRTGTATGGGGNLNPTASIIAPLDQATYTAPANIQIIANAESNNAGGHISKVEFYRAGVTAPMFTINTTSTQNPYTYYWNSVAAGTYILTVKAYDEANNVITSSPPVTITVGPAQPSGGTRVKTKFRAIRIQ